MRLSFITLAMAAVPNVAMVIPPDYVLHEKRTTPLHRAQRLGLHVRLPMRIALKSNKNARQLAEKWLMDVSHPRSARYGQHWSEEEVVAAFAPSNDTVGAVTDWLTEFGGIARERITSTKNKAWLAFDATVEEAERLLVTEYFEQDNGKERIVGCDQYHLPSHILEHVDYVAPGVKGMQMKISGYVGSYRVIE